MMNSKILCCLSLGLNVAVTASASETLLHLDYDNDLKSVKEGSDLLPFVCNASGTDLRGTPNAGFLRLANGEQRWVALESTAAANIKTANEELTIEFFLKGNPETLAAWHYVMTIGGPWSGQWAAIVDADASKNIRLQIDGFSSANTSASLVDGKWHHVAIVVKPINGGAGSHVEAYVDYSRVLNVDNETTPFKYSCCGTLDINHNSGFACGGCDVDEVRFTRGTLDVSEFMRLSNPWPEDGVFRVSFDDDVSSVKSGDDLIPYVCTANGEDLISGINGGYLHLVPNSGMREFGFPYESFLAKADELTIEFFVKCDPENLRTWQLPLVFGSTTDGNSHVFRVESDGNKGIFLKILNGLRIAQPNVSLVDGKWHHVAIRVNPTETGCHVETFFDYKSCAFLYGSSGDIDSAFNYEWLATSKLCLNYSNSGVDIDELRFTRGLLQSDEFMRLKESAAPKDGDAIVHLAFDDGTVHSLVYREEEGTSSSKGTFEDESVRGRGIVEHGTKEVLRNLNLKSHFGFLMYVNEHYALKPENCDSCTIEFFIKGGSDLTAWQMPFCYGAHWDASNRGLAIQVAGDGKNLYVKPGVGSADYGAAISLDISDSRWHHFAVTVEQSTSNPGGTRFEFFADYKSVKVWDFAGKWNGLAVDQIYFSQSGTFGFDEFRITKGVLPVEKFLDFSKTGMILIFR